MKFIKQLIPYKYKRAVKEKLGVPSLHWSLLNLKKNGFDPKTVIDVGAYEGFWTIELLEVFPEAKVLMIEAQQMKSGTLQRIKQNYPNVNYQIALLSSADNVEKYFLVDETGSRITTDTTKSEVMVTRSLDTILAESGLPLPDFIKLDVQGHELEVLKGAGKALSNATLCLLEITLIELGTDSTLMAHMISYMSELNYQPYDISHFIRRPFDNALYQVDMFFVKKDSFLVTQKRWS